MSYRRIGALCCSAAGSVLHAAGRPGGYGAGAPPDPIPNSAVKACSADGTLS